MISNLWEPVFAFALAGAGTGLTLIYSKRLKLIDVPNHRSSHSVPIPRGGGLALIASVFAVAAYEVRISTSQYWLALVPPAAALIALTIVGWFDDRRSTGVGIRIAVQLACGAAAAFLVNSIAPLPGMIGVAWLAWWIFWSVASINIVNFMDGIDGMVACQGIVYGTFLFALLPSGFVGSRFGLILAAACAGFLLWNWAPAKLFMGDVGSGPLGLLFVLGGALALEGAPAAVVFLPLCPLFFDALLTLIVRYRRGARLTDAHRDHLYQRVANDGVSHSLVSSIYALAAAIGAFVAVSVKNGSNAQMAFAIAIYVLAVAVVWKLVDTKFPNQQKPSTNA